VLPLTTWTSTLCPAESVSVIELDALMVPEDTVHVAVLLENEGEPPDSVPMRTVNTSLLLPVGLGP
jgi:hypothetical protein